MLNAPNDTWSLVASVTGTAEGSSGVADVDLAML